MSRNTLSHHLCSLSLAVLVAGCTWGGKSFAESPAVAAPEQFSSETSYQMYHAMAAEMMLREGQLQQAAEHYAAAAAHSNDPAVVRRATEVAIQAKQADMAKKLLSRWLELEPDSVEVRQYRILLRSRLEEYDAALDDVVWVRDHIEKKEGHGFEFVVSLLALEAGVNNSYEIFKRYAEKVDDSPKVQLVVTSLAVNADKYEEALAAAALVQEKGNDAQKEQATRLRARALLALKRTDDAVDELTPVIKTTQDQELKLEYGRMLIMADRREEAKPLFKQLYASQPENADILYTLGLLYLEQKEYAFAEPLMKKLLKIPGRKHEASYFLAQIYEGQDRLDEALAAYDDALSGDFAREAIGRKTMLLKQEQGMDAALAWLSAEEKDSSIPARRLDLLMARAQLFHDAGRYQEAVDVYNSAEQSGSSQRDILYARSLTYDRMGEVAKAERDLRAILADDPEDADALNALGYMLTVSTDRYVEAKELISKALQLSPSSPAILDSMGWVSFKLNELEAAEQHLRQAFEKMADPEVASHLIEVLSARGKLAEAKKILQDMLAEYPDDKMLVDVKERLVELSVQ
ncbi:MAG: tetratricopeptide repeat protein [Thiolinea sp.]